MWSSWDWETTWGKSLIRLVYCARVRIASDFLWIHLRDGGVSAVSLNWPADQSLYDVTNEMDSMRLSEVDSNLSRLVIRTLLLFRTG